MTRGPLKPPLLKRGRRDSARTASYAFFLSNAICNTSQAAVVYDAEKNAFTLLPGSSQELCYLGEDALLEPQPLTGGEVLRLGGAALQFVPFCGADFHW